MPNILAAANVSTAQYSAILEQASDGIIIIDGGGVIREYNKKCEGLFGYAASEVIGGQLDRIIPDIVPDLGSLCVSSPDNDKDVSSSGFFDFFAKTKFGVALPIELSLTQIVSGADKTYLAVIKDVSERKITKDRLASTETKLMALLASSQLTCMTYDLETMQLTDINAEGEILLAGTRDQIVGLRPADISPEFQEDGRPSAEVAKEAIEKTVREGRNRFFWTYKRLTGETFPCEINTCVTEHDGKMIFVASIRDMTEQRQAEENLRAINEALRAKSVEADTARREAEKASRAKSSFMANMSHELRTPLNAILGFSETMALEIFGSMPNSYRDYAGHVHASASHLMEMIEELLDLSRIEAGKVELHEEEFSVCETIKEALHIVASAQSRPASEFIVPAGLIEARIFADRRIFRQILINLVGNAAKFSEPGKTIMVDCALGDGVFKVMIQDQGIGIDAEEIGRLFNPYERSRSTIARNSAGTGLGLPISRSLIRLHGGDLSLTSERGVGTCVTLHVPAERVRSFERESVSDDVRLSA